MWTFVRHTLFRYTPLRCYHFHDSRLRCPLVCWQRLSVQVKCDRAVSRWAYSVHLFTRASGLCQRT